MRLYCSRPRRAGRSPPSALALHSTCANGILYYIYATTPSTARPRITVRRRRAIPGTPTDRDPWEDVTRPCNAIDAAVLVVPCPAQPPLVPQLYGRSRTFVLSRAIDLSHFAGRAAPGPGRAGPGQRSIRMERRLVPGLVRDVGVSPQRQRALDNASLARRRLQRCPTPRSDGWELLPLCKTSTETRRCPTTRARPFRGRVDDCIRSRRPASRDARRACRGTGEPLLRASKAAR